MPDSYGRGSGFRYCRYFFGTDFADFTDFLVWGDGGGLMRKGTKRLPEYQAKAFRGSGFAYCGFYIK